MKFSVLMPVYYKEEPKYLDLALKSILIDQTVVPDEVVIVEDGHLTDDLYEVLDKYFRLFRENITRVKLEKNMGMGIAMNIGLKLAKYEWIARMDSDDIAYSDRFERQIMFLTQNINISVLGSATEEFNEHLGDLKRFRILPVKHEDIVDVMKFRNPVNHMTVFFNKSLAIQAGGYWSERFFEDYNLWYEMYKCGAFFHNLDEVLVHARIGNEMVKRRQGLSYFMYEKLLLSKFLKENFISKYQYIYLIVLKFSLRMLPVKVLSYVYKYLLRK